MIFLLTACVNQVATQGAYVPAGQPTGALAPADGGLQAVTDYGMTTNVLDGGIDINLDDQSLINGVSQIAPFDQASKQALLEAPDLAARCELLIQLMYFFGRRDGDDDKVTLQ